MRKESSNALLKILEEPPQNVYFILLSRTLNIISTIKSRTIKFHLSGMNNDELGVSKEIYYFFDGNENDILEFKKQNLSLDDIEFKINTVEDILQIIFEMKNYATGELAIKNNLDLEIKYNKSIELLARRIRFWDIENVYFFINEIENELKKEKEFLINFLSKIIINVKYSVGSNELKKLINLKNSIRSNVNVKSVIFNFFDILQSS